MIFYVQIKLQSQLYYNHLTLMLETGKRASLSKVTRYNYNNKVYFSWTHYVCFISIKLLEWQVTSILLKKKIKEEPCDWDTSLKIVKGKVENSNIANEKHHVSDRSVCQEKQEIWFEGGMQQQISAGLFLAKPLPCVLGAMWKQRRRKQCQWQRVCFILNVCVKSPSRCLSAT